MHHSGIIDRLELFSPTRYKGVAHPEIKDLRKIMPILFAVILQSIKCQIIKRGKFALEIIIPFFVLRSSSIYAKLILSNDKESQNVQ